MRNPAKKGVGLMVLTNTLPMTYMPTLTSTNTNYLRISASSTNFLEKDYEKSVHVFIMGGDDPEFEMLQPIDVEIIFDSYDDVVSSDNIFNIFGVGESIQASLEDYFLSLKEYFEIIEESKKINRHDQIVFDRLCQFLTRK